MQCARDIVLALRDLQARFAAALFDGAVEPLQSEILANGVAVSERLDIYRNNLRQGYAKALAITFPVIERLVGADYFRQLADELLRVCPSRAGNLHHIGTPFPGFLRERFTNTEYAYLADVAALEWACEEALIAPDAQVVSPEALADIEPSHYEHLRFDFHPACALVRSQYPIVHIWRANQPDATGQETIDLREGGDLVLVLRTSAGVELLRLNNGDFAVLDALARGLPLGVALETAQRADVTFDLGAALQRFFGAGVFAGIRT